MGSVTRYDRPMKPLALVAVLVFAAAAALAQTEQDVQRLERHLDAHGLTPQGNCVVSFTLTGAGYIATLDLSKCPGAAQESALARLAAALPFPSSSTVGREVSLRL